MASFAESKPPQRGLLCSAERHLWHSGVALAIYTKVSALTHGGESSYYTSVKKMAAFLGCSDRQARQGFSYLDTEGWLEIRMPEPKNIGQLRAQTNAPKERWLVRHDTWAQMHPHACFEREALPWDGEVHDQLGAQLYRVSNGKLRWFAQELKALRKNGGTDSEILAVWSGMVEARRAEVKQQESSGAFVGMQWKKLKWDFIRQVAAFAPVAA
jgi:hypothetical protein